ncbi:MAG: methyl-accepting chemotaxis protein, partial [Schwartzia sp. (in: firmicutes)]
MRLRSKMLLGIGAPFIAIFIAMGAFAYWEASQLIAQATQREMEALADYHAEEINRLLDEQRGLVDGLTQAWAMKVPTNEDFLAVARDFAKRPDIDSLYLGFPAR